MNRRFASLSTVQARTYAAYQIRLGSRSEISCNPRGDSGLLTIPPLSLEHQVCSVSVVPTVLAPAAADGRD